MSENVLHEDLEKIGGLLRSQLGLDAIRDAQRLGGLTNRTYRVTASDGAEYVCRVPGEGTEQMIVRSDERVSTQLACRVGIDAELLYFGDDGTKITRYIPDAVTMSPQTMGQPEHIRQAAEILRALHTCGEDTGVPFEVFQMADTYERVIRDNYIRYLAQRIRFLSAKVDTLSSGTGGRKLSAFLMDNVGEDGSLTVSSMTQLASRLGMGRATLYRELDRLQSRNIISRDGKTILLVKPELLQ